MVVVIKCPHCWLPDTLDSELVPVDKTQVRCMECGQDYEILTKNVVEAVTDKKHRAGIVGSSLW